MFRLKNCRVTNVDGDILFVVHNAIGTKTGYLPCMAAERKKGEKMMNEAIDEQTIKKIMTEFEKGLRNHLFSDKSFPVKVNITTVYKTAMQTLEIKFEESED